MPATLLWLNALVFILYRLAFTVAPGAMSVLVTGSVPSTSSGLVDMRSTYGGMSIGLGVLFALLARNPETDRIGVLGEAAVMSGVGTSRILGLIADGSASAAMYIYLALEVLMAGIALWGYRIDANDREAGWEFGRGRDVGRGSDRLGGRRKKATLARDRESGVGRG